MRRPALVRLLVAPAATVLLLSGCGAEDSEPDAGASASSEESSAAAEESEAAEPAGDLTAEDFGDRVLAAFLDAGTVQFTLEQTTAGQTSSGTGEADLGGEQVRSRVQLETPQGQVEALTVDGLFYLQFPGVPGGKYLEVDPQDESGLGALVGQLGGNSDPSSSVKVFEEATEVSDEGQEEIDGVETTRYRVVLPSDAVAESLGADEQVASLLPEEVTYQVWVDADDLIRRLSSEIEVAGQTSSTVITYTGYGEPVDVEAPPADQVTDQIPGLPGGAGGSTGR